jgi:hypothetical protein
LSLHCFYNNDAGRFRVWSFLTLAKVSGELAASHLDRPLSPKSVPFSIPLCQGTAQNEKNEAQITKPFIKMRILAALPRRSTGRIFQLYSRLKYGTNLDIDKIEYMKTASTIIILITIIN